jgi:hypothetical protein
VIHFSVFDTGPCMRNMNKHTHDKISGMHTRFEEAFSGETSIESRLDNAIVDFNRSAKSIEERCEVPGAAAESRITLPRHGAVTG